MSEIVVTSGGDGPEKAHLLLDGRIIETVKPDGNGAFEATWRNGKEFE